MFFQSESQIEHARRDEAACSYFASVSRFRKHAGILQCSMDEWLMESTNIGRSVYPGKRFPLRWSSKPESSIAFNSSVVLYDIVSGITFSCSLTFVLLSAVKRGFEALFRCVPEERCYGTTSLQASLSCICALPIALPLASFLAGRLFSVCWDRKFRCLSRSFCHSYFASFYFAVWT